MFWEIKNGVKKCLNKLPSAYPSNRVTYEDTTVKDELDTINSNLTKNEFGSRTNITSYTTIANCFTCPSDGYLQVGALVAGFISQVTIYDPIHTTGGLYRSISVAGVNGTNWVANSIYVKKGMRLVYSGTGNDMNYANFVSLS